MRIRALPTLLVGLLVGLVIGGAALVWAAADPTPRETTVVKVCVGKKNTVVGATVKGKCPKGSSRVLLNQTGPAGPPGAPGPPGSPGADATATATVTATPTAEPGDVIDGGAP